MAQNPFEQLGSPSSTHDAVLRGKAGLDFEESAVDSYSDVEGFFDEQRPAPSMRWLRWVIVLACVVLVGKLFSLQIMRGHDYRVIAEQNRLRSETILAPRGLILDRYGKPLAQNTASFSLVAVPFDLPKEGLPEVVQHLAETLHVNKDDIINKLAAINRNSLEPVVLQQDIAQSDSILFETRAGEFPGFSVRSVPIREYLEPETFSHLLGYAGIVSSTELTDRQTQGYEPIDYIGKAGLELSYESALRGTNGQEQIEVNALGRPVKVLGTIDPKPGNTLVLNIDKELQEQLYQNFIKNSPRVKGAAIAMNPRTGQILAMVSLPGFNNNLFAHGISATDYQALIQDKNLPLFDRAIAGTYPPGSTVKPMVGLAVLEQGVVQENTVVTDRGVLVIPNQFNPNQLYNFYGWKAGGLGPMTVKSAIAESSDIYFYTVVGGHSSYPSINPLGIQRLADYYRKFQVDKTSGIDLQGEKPGLVPDPAWKEQRFPGDRIASKWYLGDSYHVAIGQGDMLVTPLRVALWTATIANNGVGYKPEIVQKIVDPNGKTVQEMKPEISIPQFASDKNIKIIQAGMRQTVTAGSGSSLANLPISVAGKTGTSQFDGADPTRTHAWFTSYAPFEDPQIVVTVLVEAGGEGHAAAAPIAKNVLQWWAENRYNK